MANTLTIAAFGILGVLSRYGVDLVLGRYSGFPWGILGINVLGSALAGAVYVLAHERFVLPTPLSQAILIGFCGGFTTFSAYTLQAFLMMEKAEFGRGLAYLVASPLLGLVAAALGIYLART